MNKYSTIICTFLSIIITACGESNNSYNNHANILTPAKESADNYTLSISNLSRSISFQIASISNITAKATQFNITEGGANDVYDSATFPSILPIVEQNNLVAHWVTYLGGPEGDCPPFDFNGNINIQVNPQKHQCEVQQLLPEKYENHLIW